MSDILHIPVSELWDRIKKMTDDNPYVYEDDDYLHEHYPEVVVLKQLIKDYGNK